MIAFLSGPQAMDFTLGNLLTIVAMLLAMISGYIALLRSFDSRFAALTLQIAKVMEGDIRELRLRITTLETGTEGWTKELRDRSHHLAEMLNAMALKIDRLERVSGCPAVATTLKTAVD
jgi:hypothetical protein